MLIYGKGRARSIIIYICLFLRKLFEYILSSEFKLSQLPGKEFILLNERLRYISKSMHICNTHIELQFQYFFKSLFLRLIGGIRRLILFIKFLSQIHNLNAFDRKNDAD